MKRRVLLMVMALIVFLSLLPSICIHASAATTYYANGKAFPNATYPLDGSNQHCECGVEVGTGVHWCCWRFAVGVYSYIWDCDFVRADSNNLLRNLSASDRTLTAEHLYMCLSQTAPGAHLRIDNDPVATNFDNDGHSLIFLAMNTSGTGAVFIEGNYDGQGRSRIAEWSFTELAKYEGYKYIKYIIWPGAPAISNTSVQPGKPSWSGMSSAYTTNDTIKFQWTETEKTTHYNLYFDAMDANGNWYSSETLSYAENGMTRKMGVGKYRVCVQAVNANAYGTPTTNSDYWYFEVKKAVVAPETPVLQVLYATGNTSVDLITFTWVKGANTTYNNLWIDKMNEYGYYSSFCTYNQASPPVQRILPAGKYRAKLLAVNAEDPDNPVTTSGEWGYFEIVNPSGTCGDNLTWELDAHNGGLLTISGTGEMYRYSQFATPWYDYAGNIKLLHMEEGVTSIGSYAFSNLYNLTSVDLPDSLQKIGNYAFCGCKKLTAVIIPKNVEYLGTNPFVYAPIEVFAVDPENTYVSCTVGEYSGGLLVCDTTVVSYAIGRSNTHVFIPSSGNITRIGGYAFAGSNINSVGIDIGMMSINGAAFSNSKLYWR